MRPYISALVLLALCLTPAACGEESESDSKARYERDVKTIFDEATRANQAVADDGARIVARTALTTLDEVVVKLRALDAPSEVEQAHADLTNGIAAFVDLRRPALEAMSDGRLREAVALGRKELPLETRQRVLQARETFAEKGYDLGAEPPLE